MVIKRLVVYIIGIGLIIGSFLYITHAAVQADLIVPRDTVIVAPLRHNHTFLFDPEMVANWDGAYYGNAVSESVFIEPIFAETALGFAQLSVVDSGYYKVVNLPFIYGSSQSAGDGRVVVLCRNMAWTMFGNADIINLPVYIMGVEYTVVGVVEAVAENTVNTGGFAWIPRMGAEEMGQAEGASVLYVRPDDYNPLTARIDTERLLRHLDLQIDDYTITDGNSFAESVVLRGQILLILCIPGFLIAAIIWIIRLFRLAKGKIAYIVAVFFAILTASVVAYFAWSIASIDLWLPAYVGEGLSGYSELIFNTGLLASRVYLPMHLAALTDLNFNANMAFATGILGLLIVGITKLLGERDWQKKAEVPISYVKK